MSDIKRGMTLTIYTSKDTNIKVGEEFVVEEIRESLLVHNLLLTVTSKNTGLIHVLYDDQFRLPNGLLNTGCIWK